MPDNKEIPNQNTLFSSSSQPHSPPKAPPDAKAAPAMDTKKPAEPPKVPETKTAPAADAKKPAEPPKEPGAKAAPAADMKKPTEPPKAPDAKAAPAADGKKPAEPAKAPDNKAMNYIRFWQADGESQKTSIRTATRLHQITEDGHFTGGICPYGYKLVKLGRKNKKGVELNDLAINEDEAPVVRMIYDKYVVEGYGPQRIANYLREINLKNRSGKNWHPATIRGILRNLTYTGVLRSGDSRSPLIKELQIIDEDTFMRAQEICYQRSSAFADKPRIPMNTRGNSLLAGNVFCGHCGARLCLTTSGKSRPRADGTDPVRVRYACQTKTRTHENCDGQTGYTAHILDGMINDIVHTIFRKVGQFSESEIVRRGQKKKISEKQAIVRKLQRETAKTEKDLHNLRNEIMKALDGSSAFTPELLGGMIKEQEAKYAEQQTALEAAQKEAENTALAMQEMSAQYNQFVEWAYVYDTASMETRKMIVAQLFERIEVYRDYKLKIKFTISVEQFLQGLDNIA